jgi:hypothetical protein
MSTQVGPTQATRTRPIKDGEIVLFVDMWIEVTGEAPRFVPKFISKCGAHDGAVRVTL